MAEWQVARLIPTWGIDNEREAETRATSATLAVLSVVREFSSALLTPLGASSARRASVECFVETSFKLKDGQVVRPDGLIRVSYGKSSWTALVEVKTGQNQLRAEQVNSYWETAREFGFDAVLTISNEFAVSDQHPTEGLRVRTNSKVQVHHFSWTRVLTSAVMCKVHRGVEDPEQAWILGELIRYLECDASGVAAFSDMGPNWMAVRDGAKHAVLSKTDDNVSDIAQRWDQLLRFIALRLSSEIGADIEQILPKDQREPKQRLAAVVDELSGLGTLSGELRIPNAVGNVSIDVDLRARRIATSTQVGAPTDRGNRARHTWLLRQLGDDVPGDLIVEAWQRHGRTPVSATLDAIREDRSVLEDSGDRDVLRYRLIARSEMGLARKAGGKSLGFVDSVVRALDGFYGTTAQRLTAWVPPAPRLVSRPVQSVPDAPREIVDSKEEVEEAIDDATETALAATAQREPAATSPGAASRPIRADPFQSFRR